MAEIEKMIAEYDLTPKPPRIFPDDPPPHEGAMIALPNVVEPPDLILVEVLGGSARHADLRRTASQT